jgi:Ca2+-binding EF-hand superfamily protein
LVFGFGPAPSSTISFKKFMYGISLFNSLQRIEDKLKVAFQMQDFDNDGVISRGDLAQYVDLVTARQLSGTEVSEICDEVMRECAVDPDTGISPANFQEVFTPADSETELHIYV